MSHMHFAHFTLRTTDLAAAQAFYAEVAGWRVEGPRFVSEERGVVAALSPLPERARALGAPAHWLGHVTVADLAGARERWLREGAQVLGPTIEDARGASVVLRDPLGAVLAISSADGEPSSSIAWHELHTTDGDRAWALYSSLFGWRAREATDLGSELGVYRSFAWDEAGPAVGAIASTARRAGVHTHWLFYFDVDDVDAAAARVRAHGGQVHEGVRALPTGERIAVCDDPQGAAFGLRRRAR